MPKGHVLRSYLQYLFWYYGIESSDVTEELFRFTTSEFVVTGTKDADHSGNVIVKPGWMQLPTRGGGHPDESPKHSSLSRTGSAESV